MPTEIAFWDTSALLPLCVRQDSTPKAVQLARSYNLMTVWWGTAVEMECALARQFSSAEAESERRARSFWRRLQNRVREISPSERVRALALQLPSVYGLRAMDSFQLSAALVWSREKPRHRPFICFDEKLAAAAEKAGFTIL